MPVIPTPPRSRRSVALGATTLAIAVTAVVAAPAATAGTVARGSTSIRQGLAVAPPFAQAIRDSPTQTPISNPIALLFEPSAVLFVPPMGGVGNTHRPQFEH